MARYQIERGGRRTRGSRTARITLMVILLLLLAGARSLASYAIEFQWWKEVVQLNTLLSMLTYSLAPLVAATLLAFGVLWTAHVRALRFAGARVSEHRAYAQISVLVVLVLAYMISAS